MSILIKGMEMPQAGDMIICGQINGKLQCTIVTRGKSTKWCEASEVSAPHGRLIDADEIEKCVHEWYDVGEYVFADTIRNADTLIEAEVSE